MTVAAAMDGELRHFNGGEAFLEAVLTRRYMFRFPGEYQEFPGAWGC